jgi:hypothetical protein
MSQEEVQTTPDVPDLQLAQQEEKKKKKKKLRLLVMLL